MSVKGVSVPETIDNINFSLHKGEILGIGGLSECGMHEVGKAVFGASYGRKGSVTLADGYKVNTIHKKLDSFAGRYAKLMSVKMTGIQQYVSNLSGGNKQKVVLARWIGKGSNILVLDSPTRGIDVKVKADIYALMTDLKEKGKSIIMISEELPELIGMSDRILIMKDGKINGEFKM
jgi:ribose transport system ATP-binding protein